MHISTMFVLLIQVTLILLLSRAMGWLATRVRQPQVVGEMVAGIVLGPSVFGWLTPDLAGQVFPADSIQLLNVLAQLGVIFFLFLIGLELNPRLLRDRARAALLISHSSIVAPFVLGMALTWAFYPGVFAGTVHKNFLPVALFMGAAMSVTAFPVLARILTERELLKTKIGAVAITCAAIDDVTAWCMLAFVLAVARAQGLGSGLITAGLSIAYAALMLLVIRPALGRLAALYEARRGSPQMLFAAVLVLMFLSAAATDLIGIHALFGAFLMGAIMPKGSRFVGLIMGKLEDLTVLFLLPIFFAYSGLQTRIGLLDSPALWGLTGVIVLVACLGKFGGSALAARVTGLGWRESSAIGVLMNTRGLVELVILNIGLSMGVISDVLFAMLVIMALVTTAMTTPILEWVYPRRFFAEPGAEEGPADGPKQRRFKIVIPVSRPESGTGLARVAAMLGAPADRRASIDGLFVRPPHFHEGLGIHLQQEDEAAERSALAPLMAEAQRLDVPARSFTFASRDVASDIARVARDRAADLVLMGFHKPVIGQTILGGTVHRVLTGADADVAILVDRGLGPTPSVLVPYQGSAHDRLAVELASRMAALPGVNVTILHVVPRTPARTSEAVETQIRKQEFPDSVQVWVIEDPSPLDAVLRQSGDFNLIVIGLAEEWGLTSHLFGFRAERIASESRASLLLVRKHLPFAELQAQPVSRPTAAESPATGQENAVEC